MSPYRNPTKKEIANISPAPGSYAEKLFSISHRNRERVLKRQERKRRREEWWVNLRLNLYLKWKCFWILRRCRKLSKKKAHTSTSIELEGYTLLDSKLISESLSDKYGFLTTLERPTRYTHPKINLYWGPQKELK